MLPGEDPDDPFDDPTIEANDRKDDGDFEGAYRILMDLVPGRPPLPGRSRASG